jgi:integrase
MQPLISSKQLLEPALTARWSESKDGDRSHSRALRVLSLLAAGPPVPGAAWAARLRPERVREAVSSLRDAGLSNSSINRHMAALSAAVEEAKRAGLLPAGADLGWRQMREPRGRLRVVTPLELEALESHTAGVTPRYFWMFLADTGLRVGEALRLEWRDVIWDSGITASAIDVKESKNGGRRRVPLSERARAGLDGAERSGDRILTRNVFASLTPSAIHRAWKGARLLMDLEHDKEFVPHALRHTCATNLVANGCPLPVVQAWMGHKSIAMTMRYAHVGDAQVLGAVKYLERP